MIARGFTLYRSPHGQDALPLMYGLDPELPYITHITPIKSPRCPYWFFLLRFVDSSVTCTVYYREEPIAVRYFPNQELLAQRFRDMAFCFIDRHAPECVEDFMAYFKEV